MASRLLESPSIVEYLAGHEGYRCGYCKQDDTNFSRGTCLILPEKYCFVEKIREECGMWAHAMTVEDYQALIDRGWRRSGKYCYKPTMDLTCCPHYTIRCDAPQFKISKSQRKVLKRVNRYLINGVKPGETCADKDLEKNVNLSPEMNPGNECTKAEQSTCSSSNKIPESNHMTTEIEQSSSVTKSTEKTLPKKGTGPDPNKPPCKKAKELRKERKLQKMVLKADSLNSATSKKNISKSQNCNLPKSLEELIEEPFIAENPAHSLKINLVRSCPPSPGYKQTELESFQVFKHYQMSIHKESEEETTMRGFKQFLVDSPLKSRKPGKLPEGYGSFHQHYVLDGKLIAVGVIDILPHCVSSVYLYYHPDFDFLSLGTYTALQELAFTRKLHKLEPQLNFYYMGYYIHSCPKMKYKGQYDPSYLLCPETFTWKPIEQCALKLDHTKYSRFEEDTNKEDEDGKVDLDKTLILHDGEAMLYRVYRSLNKGSDDTPEVLQYSTLVGKKCAQRMLLYRS